MRYRSSAGTLFVALVVFLGSLVVIPAQPLNAAAGDPAVTGSIYVDFDRDGEVDPGEAISDSDPLSPPSGVTVTAFDATGASVNCAVTPGSPPTYSCPVENLTGSSFRVEFTLDAADEAAGWASASSGPDYGTSVRFVSPGEVAHWATVPPSQCPTTGDGFGGNANSANGKVFTTCFVNGDRDAGGPQDVVVGLNYDTTGAIEKLGLKGDGDNATNAADELGAVWGVAYDEWNSTLFTSAVLKRHNQLGSQGIDGLYWMDYPTGAWQAVALNSLGGPSYGTAFARDLEGTDFSDPTHDAEAFSRVGREGIGDINVTPDGRTMLVANLLNRSVEVYDVTPTATGNNPVWLRSIPIANPGCSDTANPDDYEIWALHTQDTSSGYVGVTCTAENSAAGAADLEAHVVEIDIAGGVAGPSVFTIPLDYDRACPGGFPGCFAGSGVVDGNYLPWGDTPANIWVLVFRNQPLLADIEFDSDGSMVIGIMDRAGLQVAPDNYGPVAGDTTLGQFFASGDLLHACNTSGDPDSPTWLLEGAAGSACDPFNNFPDATGGNIDDQTNHLGPGGLAEWYGDERFLAGNSGHAETSHGGLYLNPYFDEVVVSSMDPFAFNSGGLSWYQTADGANTADAELYNGLIGDGLSGKGVGIGDVEGCFIPIEIGNFVWLDLDGDGIQDPGETPLSGVTVTLFDVDGNVVATTTTDANGEYYFDTTDGLEANTDYTISFDVSTNTSPLPAGFTNADLAETVPDATAATGDDNSDSDVVNGDIVMSTGDPGMNDHTFDAGYTLPYDLALEKTLDPATIDAATGTVTFEIEVHNQGQTVEDFDVTDYLDYPVAGTWEDIDLSLNPGGTTAAVDVDYDGTPDPGTELTWSWDATNPQQPVAEFVGVLPLGQSVVIELTLVWADPLPTGTNTLENWAEISNFDDGDPNTGDAASGDLVDQDSMPDNDPADDLQPDGPGDATDNEINDDGTVDEDDHDVAGFTLFDLALQKQLADGTNLASVLPGDSVTFTITISNQGLIDGSDIEVTDYLPAAGLTLADSAWTDNGDGTASIVYPGPLVPGSSAEVDITFTVDDDASGQINNWAEISAANPTDAAGETVIDEATGLPIADLDSTPNDDPDDDNQPSGPNATTDDETGESGLAGGDEDDHDVAGVVVGELTYDLALAKKLDPSTFPPSDWATPGASLLTFNIEVTNQDDPVQTIELTDYVQSGFTYDPADNPSGSVIDDGNGDSFAFTWGGAANDTAPVATVATTGLLETGETIVVPITLELAADWDGGPLVNWAEISNFDNDDDPTNGDASDGTITDTDSTPDGDIANDAQPTGPGADGDNHVDGNGDGTDAVTGDEDDHDVAGVPVFDLALRKTLDAASTQLPVAIGQDVTFLIEVFNQGTVDGSDITLADYVDLSKWDAFDPSSNPAGTTTGDQALPYTWSAAGTDGSVSITGTIAPGESIVVPVMLTIAAGADLSALANVAEISGATATEDDDGDPSTPPVPLTNPDGTPVTDIDSTPDANDGDPLVDDEIDNAAGDEDDHDIALVDAPTYSLGNQVWFDDDNNGSLDADEDPIQGVVVHLFSDADGDGQPDDLNGDGVIDAADAIATDTTDADGAYLFTDLLPGDYVVGIAPENWDPDGALAGMLSSDPTEVDPNTDVDDDDNGFPCGCPDGYVFSGSVTLSGAEPTNETGLFNDPNTPDGNSNLTVDFGFWTPTFDLALRKALDDGSNLRTVAIGDEVTFTITLLNQGDVAGDSIIVVDYLPAALELADDDWQAGPNGATISVPGPLLPGESVTVDITTRAVADGPVENTAEISSASAVDANGAALVFPNGDLLFDADSVPDANNSETPVDDETGNRGGDEDDHDIARLQVLPAEQPRLAFTGADSRTVTTVAMVMLLMGFGLVATTRRRTREQRH